MPDTKISALTALSAAPATGDLLPIVDVSDTSMAASGTTKYITIANVLTTPVINGLLTVTQATANAGVMASTGYSLTGSNATNMIDLAGTWNTSGTPTAIKLNMTDTASNAASLLMDLQVGGVSKFKVDKYGALTIAEAPAGVTSGSLIVPCDGSGNQRPGIFSASNVSYPALVTYGTGGAAGLGKSYMWSAYTAAMCVGPSSACATPFPVNAALGFTAYNSTSTPDVFLLRGGAAATLQIGADVNGAAVNQIFKAHNGITGTDIGSANLTLAGGVGTGAGTGGSLILSTATTLGTGTTAQTLVPRVTISRGAVTTDAATITLADAVDVVLNTTTGTKIGTATGQKLGFWNATPVVQQVLATGGGATVDNVITLLQTLGLCKQS